MNQMRTDREERQPQLMIFPNGPMGSSRTNNGASHEYTLCVEFHKTLRDKSLEHLHANLLFQDGSQFHGL